MKNEETNQGLNKACAVLSSFIILPSAFKRDSLRRLLRKTGAAWRAVCETRFVVPVMRVRQVRALSFASQAIQEGKI
jgi:hypothetical protein